MAKYMKWYEWYEIAKKYYAIHGNLEISRTYITEDGFKLGAWIKEQRRYCNPESEKGKLLLEIGMRFEKIKLDPISWEEMYGCAKNYFEEYGDLEVPQRFRTNDGVTYDKNGKIYLGRWIANQRQNCNPESERGKLLREIGMRFEKLRGAISWEEMYDYAKKYFEEYGDLEVPQKFRTSNGITYDEKGKIELGIWIKSQRQQCNPESEKGKLLLEIGMRFEKKHEQITWEEMYEYAKKYYYAYGNLEVPSMFRTNDGVTYDANGKIGLGAWIVNQRQQYNPESEKGILLLKIGMIFDLKDAYWEKMYEYAKKYYYTHGDLEVLYNFKTNDGITYDANGKVNLGLWVNKQRFNCNPESEKGKLLLQIGMRFERRKMKWEVVYEYAKKYYYTHGDLEVSSKFKTNDGITYDENGKIELGLWIITQRCKCDPTSERGKLLLEIGMRFGKKYEFIAWEVVYEYAKKYFKKYDNLDVPYNFRTNDGITYDVNGDIKLGAWISAQRCKCDPESEKGKLLLQIGMCFDRKCETIPWEKMYEIAKTYYFTFGNLNISRNYVTQNGYKLGKWISQQRLEYKSGVLTDERKSMLESIGMIFDAAKNNFYILVLCDENKIDVLKNESILRNISFYEFNAKVNYLKENGIGLVDQNGLLNEIFSTRGINFDVIDTVDDIYSSEYIKSKIIKKGTSF